MTAANQTTPRRMPPPDCRFAAHWRLEPELCALAAIRTLVLHYQPRTCLATGVIVANEALVRQPHRKQDLIPPGILIPDAKQSDLIGTWALAEACREAACWNTAHLSINVSARQLQSGVLPIHLMAALEQSGLPPHRLELELTESLLVDSSVDTLLALSAIRDLGIGLALDDFGMGSASLFMLKRLPLTAMKLHRSLVRELPLSREDAAIVRAVIEASRAMRLTTVAEGVETEAQRAFLSGIGCDEGQGPLFSHPLPAGQLRPMLGTAHS